MIRIWIVVGALSILTGTSAEAQELKLKDHYGVYWVTPKNKAYGPGAILQGYFKENGTDLYVKQVVCWPRLQPTFEAGDDCVTPQPGMNSKSEKSLEIDITAPVKELLSFVFKLGYLRKVTAKIDNACIIEISVQEQIESVKDGSCLRAVKAVRSKMSKQPLAVKLSRPSKYLLLWQTTRALYGDITYELDFSSGTSVGLQEEAVKKILGTSAGFSIKTTNADKVTLRGRQMFLGLEPRYYEQWFSASESIGQKVEETAKNTESVLTALIEQGLESGLDSEAGALLSEFEDVQQASKEADAKIDELLEDAK